MYYSNAQLAGPSMDRKFLQRQTSLTGQASAESAGSVARPDSARNSSLPPADLATSTPDLDTWQRRQLQQQLQQQQRASPATALFPDNLIMETERLIAAIKRLLSDLQQNGTGTQAVYHADNVSADPHATNQLLNIRNSDSFLVVIWVSNILVDNFGLY